jgi:fatty-acyl-CoA synthase
MNILLLDEDPKKRPLRAGSSNRSVTPSRVRNPTVPVLVGEIMTTLLGRIERATLRGGSITFLGSEGPERITWARMHEEAVEAATALQAMGVEPGNAVALLGPTSRALVTTLEGIWAAGATPVMLPLPMRLGSIDEFASQTRVHIKEARAVLVVIDPDLAAFVEPAPDDPPFLALDELATDARRRGSAGYRRPDDDVEALAVLQFTSGATADPKNVMIPHRCMVANLDAIGAVTGIEPGHDVVVSWLPLYHDMGLIGAVTLPMATGTDAVIAPPQDFLASPARWMQWMSDFGGTVTAGPNFSYALATRALRRLENLDLSAWRIAVNGAEPIDPATVDSFIEAAVPHGFDPSSMFCGYGMAEATLGVTFPPPGSGLRVDHVDARVLETERYAAPAARESERTRSLVLLGRPLPGFELRISDPETGTPRSEREVGEVEIRGTSVTPGYFRRPEATAKSFRDGWLRTGDLGYLFDDELVVCGRIKDVIIVGGRNVFPEDAERAAADIDGVRAGNVIAFGAEGRRGSEAIVVVAESKAVNVERVRDSVARRVREVIGLPPRDIVLVAPGTLPKTSSGKLQRALCRERYLTSELQLL